jgi:hypothetical protein
MLGHGSGEETWMLKKREWGWRREMNRRNGRWVGLYQVDHGMVVCIFSRESWACPLALRCVLWDPSTFYNMETAIKDFSHHLSSPELKASSANGRSKPRPHSCLCVQTYFPKMNPLQRAGIFPSNIK